MGADDGERLLPSWAGVARTVCLSAAALFSGVFLLAVVVTVFRGTGERPPGIRVLGPLAMAAIPVGLVAYTVWMWGRRTADRGARSAQR